MGVQPVGEILRSFDAVGSEGMQIDNKIDRGVIVEPPLDAAADEIGLTIAPGDHRLRHRHPICHELEDGEFDDILLSIETIRRLAHMVAFDPSVPCPTAHARELKEVGLAYKANTVWI